MDYVSEDGIGHEVPSLYYIDPDYSYSYDLAGDLFEHLLTNLESNSVSSINDATSDWQSAGIYKRFLQTEFVDKNMFEFSGLARFGYVYYPNSCLTNSCKVHMHLHGCADIA